MATDGSGLATVSDPVEVDADPLPDTVSVVVSGDGLAVEGGENGKVAVRRAGDLTNALSVRYKVAGSAKAGIDYKTGPITGIALIPAGVAQVKVKIKPIDNTTVDGTRVAKVKLLPSLDGSYSLGTTRHRRQGQNHRQRLAQYRAGRSRMAGKATSRLSQTPVSW